MTARTTDQNIIVQRDGPVPPSKAKRPPIDVHRTQGHQDRAKPLPSAERLRELLLYDPQTGALTKRATGRAATRKDGKYLRVSIDFDRFLAHRVIWKMVTGDDPPEQVDHWNRDRTDNRWANLRLASWAQSAHNRNGALRSGLSRGLRRRENGKYRAAIKVDGREVSLGTFATAEEADRAYLAEAAKSEFLCTDNVSPYAAEPTAPRLKRRAKHRYRPADGWLVVKL